ncbi:MAG: aminopeptidase N [Ornithinimicrobium sp.]
MPGTNLTREEAQQRSQLIEVQAYDITLDLTTGPQTFGTTTRVTFDCVHPGSDTFIDLIAESVQSIEVNGHSLVIDEVFADSRIQLCDLQEHNELRVVATGAYMNTGEGLHRFVDPADDEVYLYTQFEVPDSRRMYAVFEQPDLKATFAFTVTAPAHWQIISNQPTPEPEPVADDGATSESDPAENSQSDPAQGGPSATWTFSATPRISSYITALVAGPYDVVRDEVATREGTVPLGVFCRKSLREHLDAENILACTKAGFAFFEVEFDCAYPFAKYDQIFTPEYNMGAMENAGCVTIVEDYIFRSKVTETMIERRALTILHELAHMWFGDLVTMRWWDDLWLNESFAEWASTVAQAEATEWTEAWTTFATSEKAWAYRQDQLSSTHPVAADMVDLAAVEVNFDGITYAKGASVLKQLVAYVGREAFTGGLRAYFAKHAWGNTTLADLLTELEATSGRALGDWSQVWLQTAGVNTMTPDLTVEDGVITAATIIQAAPEDYPTLRPHRLAVGSYTRNGQGLVRTGRVELDVEGERTEVPDLVGQHMPDVLLLNDDDLAYTKIRLDEHSLATALADPRALQDSLPRALVLGAAWDMTRDAHLPASDYVRLALRALPGESDSTLLRMLLLQLSTAARMYAAPAHRPALLAEVASGLRAAVTDAAPGSDAQLQLMAAFAAFATAEEDLAMVRGALDGSEPLEGLVVDQDQRWGLLTSLVAAGAAEQSEVEIERERDNTSHGREKAARAFACAPTAAAKEAAWEAAVEQTTLPNAVLAATAAGFGRARDPEVLRPFVERYFEVIEDVWDSRTHAIAEGIVSGFYPMALADRELLEATQTWLDEHPEAASGLRRTVSESRDALVRAVAAQAVDASGTLG